MQERREAKYDQWWNLSDTETGHIEAIDLGSVEILDNVEPNENVPSGENVYADWEIRAR